MYRGMGSGNRFKGIGIIYSGLGARLMSPKIIIIGPVLFCSQNFVTFSLRYNHFNNHVSKRH